MEVAQGILGISFGYSLWLLLSHPSKFLKNKLPEIKLKSVQFLPNFRIKIKQKLFHIHHWIFLILILGILIYTTNSFTQLLLLKGFILGGAIQGITYKDRFKILIK